MTDAAQWNARFTTESNTAMSTRQNVGTRTIARRSDARLMARKFTLIMCAGPATRHYADITRSTAWLAARLVSTVQLTTVFARRTRLATGRL